MTGGDQTINGFCRDDFTPVRDAFAANFADGLEVGASVAVTVDGEPVVDLWAGDRNEAGDPWVEDTIVNVYSTTKTMAALSVLMCVDRGLLDLDTPVAAYWPEFGANGKDGVLVRHVMSHSTGLSGFEPAIAVEELYDWEGITAQLAAQAPWWEPGTASGYHAVTQGYLQGELVRRVAGRTIGTFFREEVAEPLGADFHIGLDPVHDHRVGELDPPPVAPREALAGLDADSIPIRTFTSVGITGREPRTEPWRRAEIPAAGGIGHARAVARVHSALACGGSVDGVELLSPATIDALLEPQIDGVDLVLATPIRFGLGFGLPSEQLPLPNPRSCYWGGWGGSLAIIDLDARMSIAYVMNKMAPDLLGDRRGANVTMGAYQSVFAA